VKARILAWLVRHRWLATPEEDAYLSWADAWLDQREVERRIRLRDEADVIEQLDALGIRFGQSR
jgi:hypothetical protein